MYLPLQYQAPKGSVFPLSVTQEDLRESLSPHRFFGVEDIYALWERTPEGSFNRVEGFRSTDDIDIHLKELQTEGAIPTLDFVGFRKKFPSWRGPQMQRPFQRKPSMQSHLHSSRMLFWGI